MIHYSDHLEKAVGECLTRKGITFIHESQDPDQDLDFYLPDYDVYIEVKQFYADRISRQLASRDNVIVIQGRKSIEFLADLVIMKYDDFMRATK